MKFLFDWITKPYYKWTILDSMKMVIELIGLIIIIWIILIIWSYVERKIKGKKDEKSRQRIGININFK